MDFHGNRANENFIYRRVVFPTYEEAENYDFITGGSIEISAFSDLKVTGTLNVEGEKLPNLHDMVRIYYQFTDDAGDMETYPLATMFVNCAKPAYYGNKIIANIDCYSPLYILSAKKVGFPYTVGEETNALSLAVDLTQSLDLRCEASPAYSSYLLNSPHTFDAGTSYLEIINWLLTSANYSSAWVNEYGTIQMTSYEVLSNRPTQYTFKDDEYSIMYPQIDRQNDISEVPNVVRYFYSADNEYLWASATDVSHDTRTSLPNIGYEKTLYEQVDELAGDTIEDRLDNLKNAAKKKLEDNVHEIEYVEFSHAWVPVYTNAAIDIKYDSAGFIWDGTITNLQIELVAGIPTKNKSRKIINNLVDSELEGGYQEYV